MCGVVELRNFQKELCWMGKCIKYMKFINLAFFFLLHTFSKIFRRPWYYLASRSLRRLSTRSFCSSILPLVHLLGSISSTSTHLFAITTNTISFSLPSDPNSLHSIILFPAILHFDHPLLYLSRKAFNFLSQLPIPFSFLSLSISFCFQVFTLLSDFLHLLCTYRRMINNQDAETKTITHLSATHHTSPCPFSRTPKSKSKSKSATITSPKMPAFLPIVCMVKNRRPTPSCESDLDGGAHSNRHLDPLIFRVHTNPNANLAFFVY